jgi:hypothetical protein
VIELADVDLIEIASPATAAMNAATYRRSGMGGSEGDD